jgi:hypothetical protein
MKVVGKLLNRYYEGNCNKFIDQLLWRWLVNKNIIEIIKFKYIKILK